MNRGKIYTSEIGSASIVTNENGNTVQQIEYSPYGEVFVEERNSSFSSSYLFNAKELDNETGLYYYGARYLDPEKASWLSVDPLWEKYPGVSPYSYCVGNPVRLVDPDGREIRIKSSNSDEGFIYGGNVENYAAIEDEFVRNTVVSLNEKFNNKDSELIRAIKSKIQYSIMPKKFSSDNSTQFDTKTQTIYWDWNMAVVHSDESEIMTHSPSVRLSHELSHLEDYDLFMTARSLSDVKGMIMKDDIDFVSSYFSDKSKRQKLMSDFGSTLFTGNQGEDKAMRTEYKVGKRLGEFTGEYSRPKGKYNFHKTMPVITNSVFLNRDDIKNYK